MDDQDVLGRISQLVDEEHRLRDTPDGLGPEDEERLKAVEVALDQCWDLLRRRRGLRKAGEDPDDAGVRPPETVETYDQ